MTAEGQNILVSDPFASGNLTAEYQHQRGDIRAKRGSRALLISGVDVIHDR